MSETKFTVQDDKKTLVIERTFSAPQSKVWEAWTTPELFVKWWGPTGWTTEAKEMDFREGGSLLYGMTCEDPEQKDWYGKSSWGKMTFSEVNPKSSFTYTDIFCDENGVPTPGMPVGLNTVELIDEGDKTRLVSTSVMEKPEDLEQVIAMGMEEGLKQTWDRLEELVSA